MSESLKQAAQQALEAMELHAQMYPSMQKGYTVDAIEALHAALSQPAPVVPVCPMCDGAGTVTEPSDNSPDAYEVDVACPHCNGSGALEDAYTGVVALLKRATENYHRALPYMVKWKNEAAGLPPPTVPAPSPQAPGRRQGPPGITLEPQGHDQPAAPVDAFAEGWRMAADWANRDDLLPDMDSPQYTKERDERLADLRPQAVPMTDEVRRSYQCLLAMNTPHGFGDRIGPFVKWLQDSGITAKAEDAHQPTKEAEKP